MDAKLIKKQSKQQRGNTLEDIEIPTNSAYLGHIKRNIFSFSILKGVCRIVGCLSRRSETDYLLPTRGFRLGLYQH